MAVSNRHYNPGGRHPAAEYRFPFANDSFDFVVLASVFTHMLPEDLENYLCEVARLLRPGGRCFISFFLMNDVSRALLATGESSLQLTQCTGQYWTADPSDPEAAIGHEENLVLSLYERYGLEIAQPTQYGSWCGRQEFLSYRDLILAFKPVS